MSDENAPSRPDANPDPGTAVAPPPTKKAAPASKRDTQSGKPRSRKLPPFKVLLHNDDTNDMLHVVQTIRKLTALGLTEAFERMWDAHRNGVALLLVTHRERAELYVEQFASCSLTVTAEPDT